MVGSTGSVFPAPKSRKDDVLAVAKENELEEGGTTGAKALVDDATVKAKRDVDRILIVVE